MGRNRKLAGRIRPGLNAFTLNWFKNMLLLKWSVRMLVDLIKFGLANRAIGMSFAVIALLFLGVVIIAAKFTAPFIYTLF